jgi:hypothetical protein
MIGRKAGGDNIAKDFASFLKSMKKTAQVSNPEQSVDSAEDNSFNPEDMLVSKEENISTTADKIINESIDSLESFVKDEVPKKSCEVCLMEDCACDYAMDSKTASVVNELKKIAADLRSENDVFAADIALVTMNNIINDSLDKHEVKIATIRTLKRLASQAEKEGDLLATDLIDIAASKISKL